MLTCERFEAKLDEHMDGELGPGEKLSFALHWLMCRACRISLDTYRRTVALAHGAFDDEDPLPPSGTLSEREDRGEGAGRR